MKLGFFDQHRSDFPFANGSAALAWSLLDGTSHHALAVEAAAKSTVLLKNAGGLLPLGRPPTQQAQSLMKKPSIAVVGPFARCNGGLCYAHDYAGTPSLTNDFMYSITQRTQKEGGYPAVTYA